jgi:hypothetical protein
MNARANLRYSLESVFYFRAGQDYEFQALSGGVVFWRQGCLKTHDLVQNVVLTPDRHQLSAVLTATWR